MTQEAQKRDGDYEEIFRGILGAVLKESVTAGSADLYRNISSALEKDLIKMTSGEVAGNRTEAARIIGVSGNTLRLRIKEYGS